MPVLHRSDHKPPFWLPNGHFQSIYPALFRIIDAVPYQRERISTDDGDFLDLDWAFKKLKPEQPLPRLVILSHGLEGSSTSQYILGMIRLLTSEGYDCLSWNFRSCGGEMNKTFRFYHSGATEDLDAVVQHSISKGYKHVDLMGFSLGGNLTLKYLGEKGADLPYEVKKGMVFSVPMDLKASSMEINKFKNRVYMKRFLRTLMTKVYAKSAYFPKEINTKNHGQVRTLYDFDHIYTAAIHGFNSADDYYEKCSSMHFVSTIAIPTLIVNAVNDPMVPILSIPQQKIAALTNVCLEITDHGGHCGFRPAHVLNGIYWSEQRALEFLKNSTF